MSLQMPPIKFRLNLTYGLGGDVVWRISRWPPPWLSEQNDVSNSESLWHCDASHQVLAQSNLWFGRWCHLKISRWPLWWPSWISEWNDFSNSESLCHCDASHQVLAQSDLGFRRRCCLKNFKMAATILAILNLHVATMPDLLSFSLIQLMVLEKMPKMWKTNGRRMTDGRWTDGRRTDDEQQAIA